jgi:hypothetical protein
MPLISMIVWLGVFPAPFLDRIGPSAEAIVARVRAGAFEADLPPQSRVSAPRRVIPPAEPATAAPPPAPEPRRPQRDTLR